jgi:hypothetical protein
MANVFSKNAYNLLSLETNASYKEINRKAKEISQLAKIGEESEDDGINFIDVDRSEASINEAMNTLASPRTKFRECFFWFDNNDEIDKKFIGYIKQEEYEKAIEFLKQNAKGSTIDDLLKKKNLAILETLLLFSGNNSYLAESLGNWKEIVGSDKFWKSYEKIYESYGDEDIETEVVDEFRVEVPKYLSDVYLDASENDKSIFSEFRKVFSVKGTGVEKKVTNPALNAAALSVEKLEKMKISEDGIISDEETRDVAGAIKNIQDQLNKLVDYDLYDDSEAKVLRDRASTAVRDIVLDIHNQLGETEKGIKLIEIALTIAGTVAQKNKLKKDLEVLKDVLKQSEELSPIDDLVEAEDFEGAIELIEKRQSEFKKQENISDYLDDKLKAIVAMKLMTLDKEGFDAIDKKNWPKAEAKFNEINVWAENYIDIYNFNKEPLLEYLNGIETQGNSLDADTISVLDNIRSNVREMTQESFTDAWEGLYIVAAADGKIMPRGVRILKKLGTVRVLYSIGGWTWWIYGLGIVLIIIGWIYKKMDT